MKIFSNMSNLPIQLLKLKSSVISILRAFLPSRDLTLKMFVPSQHRFMRSRIVNHFTITKNSKFFQSNINSHRILKRGGFRNILDLLLSANRNVPSIDIPSDSCTQDSSFDRPTGSKFHPSNSWNTNLTFLDTYLSYSKLSIHATLLKFWISRCLTLFTTSEEIFKSKIQISQSSFSNVIRNLFQPFSFWFFLYLSKHSTLRKERYILLRILIQFLSLLKSPIKDISLGTTILKQSLFLFLSWKELKFI